MASNFLGVRVVWLPEGEHSAELGAKVNVIRLSVDPVLASVSSPVKRIEIYLKTILTFTSSYSVVFPSSNHFFVVLINPI